jgi:hypothetical protein
MSLTFEEVCAIVSSLEKIIVTSQEIDNINEGEKEVLQHLVNAHKKLRGILKIEEEFANETN